MAPPVGTDPPLHEARVVLAEAGIPQDGPAVVVAREEPCTERRAAMDGRGVTEAMVVRVRIAAGVGFEEEVADDRFGFVRHGRHLTRSRGPNGSGFWGIGSRASFRGGRRLTRFPEPTGSGRGPCSGGTPGPRRGSALP